MGRLTYPQFELVVFCIDFVAQNETVFVGTQNETAKDSTQNETV